MKNLTHKRCGGCFSDGDHQRMSSNLRRGYRSLGMLNWGSNEHFELCRDYGRVLPYDMLVLLFKEGRDLPTLLAPDAPNTRNERSAMCFRQMVHQRAS